MASFNSPLVVGQHGQDVYDVPNKPFSLMNEEQQAMVVEFCAKGYTSYCETSPYRFTPYRAKPGYWVP